MACSCVCLPEAFRCPDPVSWLPSARDRHEQDDATANSRRFVGPCGDFGVAGPRQHAVERGQRGATLLQTAATPLPPRERRRLLPPQALEPSNGGSIHARCRKRQERDEIAGLTAVPGPTPAGQQTYTGVRHYGRLGSVRRTPIAPPQLTSTWPRQKAGRFRSSRGRASLPDGVLGVFSGARIVLGFLIMD